ncbi:MAG: arginine deiminase-related protein, partial [Pseudomonadota bacterium]|nr:arginine deiminase-related protein [Pseudomonadota bacterium]
FRDEPTEGANLESTASICRDHVNKIGYAALSARTDIRLAERWADHFGYKLIPFDTQSHTGKPIYHTDVLMHIGSEVATICAECISDDAQRKMVLDSLNATHEVVELSMEQLLSFCGNALEVKGPEGEKILVMSEAAYKALKPEQIKVYEAHLDKILHTPLYTVERYGGGSARCMMLELF